MKTEELNYELPTELIAQEPAKERGESRLLVLKRAKNELIDSSFSLIGDFLCAGDCLVLNDTKVMQGRFFAQRRTGGRLEGLFLSERGEGFWEVIVKGAGKVKEGEEILIKNRQGENYCGAVVESKLGEGIILLRIDTYTGIEEILEQVGFPPLPPYIKRDRDLKTAEKDRQRYQTVYAQQAGAIAAPTAGLHFTRSLISHLKTKGIEIAFITLHVGLGTFKPVAATELEEHQIHSEVYSISEKQAQKINSAKEQGGRIIAVGTTSVRALESSTENGKVKGRADETKLFITPGYQFKTIDGIVTNFHLPRSTLLALVGAFAGVEQILSAYQHAIEQRYRFYSYGDAMLLM